jgi:hypothetical protein
MVEVLWQEIGGPTLKHNLEAKTEIVFDPQGLRCVLKVLCRPPDVVSE